MSRKASLVLLSLFLVAMFILSACSPAPAEPTTVPTVAPTQPPIEAPTQAPTAKPDGQGGDEVMVVVSGVELTMNDLQALEQVTIKTMYKEEMTEYTGVRILDLLEAAGAQGESIVLAADDGYEAEVPIASLTEESLFAYGTNGGLQTVLPGIGTGAWVKGVVEVRITAESEAAEEKDAEIIVVVNGIGFTQEDLAARAQVTIETTKPGQDEKEEYTGVPILDLLEATGAKGDTVVLVADDGYKAEVSVADLTAECILYFGSQGKLRSAMPGLEGSTWVKGVVEVVSAAQESSGKEVTIIDALGRSITFDQLPRRIVVPGKGAWMVGHPLYLFPEASERVLAMEARGSTVSEFIVALEPGFMDKPHLEMNAGPEQIAPLKPDAIVTKSYMKAQIGDGLEAIGLPVIYVELETPEQFFSDVTTIGQLFGNEARAREIVAFYRERMDRIEEGLKDLKEEDKPSVLVIQYSDRGGEIAFKVPPASWMQTIEVEAAGGNPLWMEIAGGGGWELVNFEQIAAWDPDKILVIVFGSDSESVMETLRGDLKWQSLGAVRDGELHAFPSDFYGWDVPDPRWILGMTWAATKIHPDRFADVDMREEVYEFYGEMYGMDKAAVDEHVLPELRGDVE